MMVIYNMLIDSVNLGRTGKSLALKGHDTYFFTPTFSLAMVTKLFTAQSTGRCKSWFK